MQWGKWGVRSIGPGVAAAGIIMTTPINVAAAAARRASSAWHTLGAVNLQQNMRMLNLRLDDSQPNGHQRLCLLAGSLWDEVKHLQ